MLSKSLADNKKHFGTTDDKEYEMIHEILKQITRGDISQDEEIIEKSESDCEAKLSREDEKQRLKSLLIEMLRDCGDRSSIHSFPSFASRKVPFVIKVIWIVCLIASWGFLVYLIRNMVCIYSEYNVVSSITIDYEAPTIFPAVDICNLCPYDGNYARNYIQNVVQNKNITVDQFDSIRQYTDEINSQVKSQIEYEYQTGTGTLSAYVLGFWIKQMLISCEYQGVTCKPSDFYWYHNYYYGNCYRFNGIEPSQNFTDGTQIYNASGVRSSTKPGWLHGLRLELYAGNQQYQQQYTYKSGFRIIIHNQTVFPFPEEEGIDVPVGMQTDISVSRTFIHRLPEPFNTCIDQFTDDVAERNPVLKAMMNQIKRNVITQYQQSYCLKICYQFYIVQKCGCASLSYAFLNLTTPEKGCHTTKDITCSDCADREFYNSKHAEECYSACPIECNTVSYSVLAKTASYPTIWYADQLDKYKHKFFNLNDTFYENSKNSETTLTFDLIANTTAMVNIFYESMQFTTITESPQLPPEVLLANIGGNLGLFTGMSILSFVEFVEMIISGLIIYFVYKKTTKKN